jgi:hypothetical protein
MTPWGGIGSFDIWMLLLFTLQRAYVIWSFGIPTNFATGLYRSSSAARLLGGKPRDRRAEAHYQRIYRQ